MIQVRPKRPLSVLFDSTYFIQVTSPSLSDSPKLERQVSELVAHINGTYGSLGSYVSFHSVLVSFTDSFYPLSTLTRSSTTTPLSQTSFLAITTTKLSKKTSSTPC